jgi:hypothetical protein
MRNKKREGQYATLDCLCVFREWGKKWRAADVLCHVDNLHLIRFVGNTNEGLKTAIATVIIMGLHSEVALG